MTKLTDFPAIKCPTCQATISKPECWLLKDIDGYPQPGFGVGYHCRKCGHWTFQNKQSAKKLEDKQ